MFKTLIPAIVIASAMAAPTLASAQDNNGSEVTRAQVRGDLIQMEQAGYKPGADRTTYPAPEQAAEQRVEAQKGVEATSYGSSMSGTSASGAPTVSMAPADMTHTPGRSLYSNH
jgi:hypothetical protein